MFANVTLSLMGGLLPPYSFSAHAGIRSAARPAYQLRPGMSRIATLRALIKSSSDRPRHTAWCSRSSFFYGPALLWDISLPRFTAALVAFVINYACFWRSSAAAFRVSRAVSTRPVRCSA